jgi:hypothetical protein
MTNREKKEASRKKIAKATVKQQQKKGNYKKKT